MNDQTQEKKDNKNSIDSKLDDLELISRSALRAGYQSLQKDASILGAKKTNEIDRDKEFIQNRIKLFEQGYQFLMNEINNKTVEGFYSLDADNYKCNC